MKFSVWFFRFALALLLCASLNGCEPASSQSQIDEEKEPHFIEGQHAINSYDFAGAIEESNWAGFTRKNSRTPPPPFIITSNSSNSARTPTPPKR